MHIYLTRPLDLSSPICISDKLIQRESSRVRMNTNEEWTLIQPGAIISTVCRGGKLRRLRSLENYSAPATRGGALRVAMQNYAA